MTRKALCLSGGATRGTFQMGAIRCIYEVYGFRPDVIAGTSIGAVNAIKLASAPPPAVNDAEAILRAVALGSVDAQLEQMRSLERIWLTRKGRTDFFSIKDTFKGTLAEEALAESTADGMPIGTQMDLAAIGLNLPLVHIFVAIGAADELSKIKTLIEKASVENAIANLQPVEDLLRDPELLNIGGSADVGPFTNNLHHGTPLYMATVSLETGKLRFVTNRAEFYERDGVTPVATALTDSDIDEARDENSQLLLEPRKDVIKTCVSNYKAAIERMATSYAELKNNGTPRARKLAAAAALKRDRERGIRWSRAAQAQIRGLSIKTIIRDASGAPDPVAGAIASASLPVLLEPREIGAEHYIDAGLREIIPIQIVLDKGASQVVAILCSTPELAEADSKKQAGLISVGARAATEIAIDEVTQGDIAASSRSGAQVTLIAPEIDVHSAMDLIPELMEISMHYGWMRAEDEMHPVTVAAERDDLRRSSRFITLLRMECFGLERDVSSQDIRNVGALRALYFSLRVHRWAIFHLASRRQSAGLPPHPEQATWSRDWETQPVGGAPTVWGHLESRSNDGAFQAELWPPSSPSALLDLGTIEDAASDRLYWIVRGAIFEGRGGATVADRDTHVILPGGVHQFLPKVPRGAHLMAETQARTAIALIIAGKRYSSPTPEWIAAAGLTGASVAIVPEGGLSQIPDDGIPYFVGNLSLVDANGRKLSELSIERTEQTDTTVDVRIHNRSGMTLTNVSVTPIGFGPAQGISVELAPTSIAANTIDLIILRLRPTSAGTFSGSLRIDSSDAAMPRVVVRLDFSVLPVGEMDSLQLTPSPLTVSAPVHSTTSYSMLRVVNSGAVTPTSIRTSIEPAELESLFGVGAALTPAALTPGHAVQVPVYFCPTTTGVFSGQLLLTTGGKTSLGNPYQRTVRVPIRGDAASSTIRLLTRTPTPDDFSRRASPLRGRPQTSVAIDVGTVRPPLAGVASVFVLNFGTLDLEVSAILGYYVTHSGSQAFPIRIAAGQWHEVKLDFGMFQAPGIGKFSETLRIASNDPITPEARVVVSGAVAGAAADVRPEFLDFGVLSLGSAAQKTAVFTNRGTVDLKLEDVSWGRTNSSFRLVAPPSPSSTVAAGSSITLTVEFGPVQASGLYEDRLVLATFEGVGGALLVQARSG